MNRLEEIANKIKLGWPENQYLSQRHEDIYNGMSKGMQLLIEALKPEIELMLKEQAKIVRHAGYDLVNEFICGGVHDGVLGQVQKRLMNLQHDWVELEEK